MSAALRVLAEHGLAEHGPEGWRRGPARLDYVAESTNAAQLHREWAAAYAKQREKWRGLIGSWLAPAVPGPSDERPLRIGEHLGQLEPPARLTGDPGPPASCVLAFRAGDDGVQRAAQGTGAVMPWECWSCAELAVALALAAEQAARLKLVDRARERPSDLAAVGFGDTAYVGGAFGAGRDDRRLD